MGFDDIDRRHRRAMLIRLECESCGTVEGVLTREQWDPERGWASAALCLDCATRRVAELAASLCPP